MKSKHLDLKKGFSLVELMIYMVLFSVLVFIISNIFSTVLDVSRESEAVSNVQQDGAYIMARLYRDIPLSTSTVPVSAGSSSSSLQLTINGVNYSYSLSSGDLFLTNNAGTFKLNGYGTTVSSLLFTRIGSGGHDTIKLQYTVTSKNRKTAVAEVKSYSTTIELRCNGLSC